MTTFIRSSYAENQKLALKCRELWGIADKNRPDLIRVLEEEFPRHYPGFTLLVVPRSELNGADGSADRGALTITLAQDIYDGAKALKSSALYAVAEEIGHFVHQHEGVRYRRFGVARRTENSEKRAHEREAKQFAALLLAPTALIRDCKTTDEILDIVSLTKPAATIRLQEIEAERRYERASHRSATRAVALNNDGMRADPSQVSSMFDDTVNFVAPSRDALAIVNVEQRNSGVCIINGWDSLGRFKNVEIRGPQKAFQLPFGGAQLLLRHVRGRAVVKVVDFYLTDSGKLQSQKFIEEEKAFGMKLLGITGEPCPECGLPIKADANSKTCECGWTSSTT
jgi:Zn-dependent peptidase ImmA (M78 family)